MKRKTTLAALLAALSVALAAPAQIQLVSPYMPPSTVDAEGAVHEDWGTVALRITQPKGARVTAQHSEKSAVPTAVTTFFAGAITMTQTVYRAPIWPRGVDVLTAQLANGSSVTIDVWLRLDLPETVSVGERVAASGGRAVVALPKGVDLVRRERAWGCTGGVVPMPGWGKPEGECDPAFKNISAGMGGVPIAYRFAVTPGAKKTVILGLCESHHTVSGQRPVRLVVEGAPSVDIDPIAEWGRHVPGCLRFDAADLNSDGRLDVRVDPHPDAVDTNPILNVIWVFPPEMSVDNREVLRGALSAKAEYYVDVGGQKDQSLFEGGAIAFRVRLEPNAKRDSTFLLACPGGDSVPNPNTTAWTPDTLRKAAEDVAKGYGSAKAQ